MSDPIWTTLPAGYRNGLSPARSFFGDPPNRDWVEALRRESLALAPDRAGDRHAQLTRLWGQSGLRELESLSRERDPELLLASLNHLAGRLQDRSPQLSLLIFRRVEELARGNFPRLADRAREERMAMTGESGGGRRIEFLARNFSREATHPATLAGMMAGSLAFQVSKTYLLSRMLSQPVRGMFTHGVGARLLAGTAATALEVPTFVLAAGGVNRLLGNPSGPLDHSLAHTALTLGGLRIFAWGGNLGARWMGEGALARNLVPSAATYAGIVSGNILARRLGLTPDQEGGAIWTDSLATLLQFSVAGRLVGQLGGARLTRIQAELEARNQAMRLGGGGIPWHLPQLIPATPGPSSPIGRGWSAGESRSPLAMMVAAPGSSAPRGQVGTSTGGPGGGKPAGGSGPLEFLEGLVRLRDRLVRRGRTPISLFRLLSRQIEKGRIAEGQRDDLHWAVYSRELFENSPLLQNRISQADLAQPERTVWRLHGLRDAIAREQGQEGYALATLIQALVYGGRIPYAHLRKYTSAAASFDLFQQSGALQQPIAKEHFQDPYRLVERVLSIRASLERERGRHYQLITLVDALRWHPDFPAGRLQNFLMVASARDLVGRLSLKRLRLLPQDLRGLTRDQVFLRLLKLRPLIQAAAGNPVSIGYILMGLRARGLARFQDGEISDTTIQYAHALDLVFNRWAAWGPHIRVLQSVPKKGSGEYNFTTWSRPQYARAHLRGEGGEVYSASYLSNLMRWGDFLWDHRKALGLPMPPALELGSNPQSMRDRMLAFFRNKQKSLRGLEHEGLFMVLLRLRPELSGQLESKDPSENRERLSLPRMVEMAKESVGERASRTSVVYASTLEQLLGNWQEWRPTFGAIETLGSKGREALEFARPRLRRSNGLAYSDNILNSFIRWGTWLWRHRRTLKID